MEKILQQILEGQNKINQKLELMENRFDSIEHRLEIMDVHLVNIDSRLSENTRFISALSQDVARTATKEDIAAMSSGIEALNTRLFKQESELILLKTAK